MYFMTSFFSSWLDRHWGWSLEFELQACKPTGVLWHQQGHCGDPRL